MQSPFKDLPREVSILVAASFFVAVGFGIVLPAIPIFAKSFGVNNAAIGLMVSAFAITRFASGLISGTLVDKFGERAVFSSGVFMVSLFTFLAGLAQSYEQLLFFRAAGGLGSSMFSVAAGSVIMRSVDDANRGRAQSVYQGSFLLGGIAGPAIGGLLSVISLRAPFFVYSGMLLCSGTVAFFFLKGDKIGKVDKNTDTSDHTTVREALAMKPYRIALFVSFCAAWTFFGMSRSILPLFIVEDLKISPAMMGFGFTLTTLIQGAFLLKAGRMSDINGRRFSLIVGTSLTALFALTLVFTMNSWMFFLGCAIVGLGGAFLSTTPAAVVGDVIEGKGGQVIGLFQMSADAGAMVAPVLLGAIADSYGYQPAFALTAVMMAAAVMASIKLPETRSSHLGQSQ